MVWKDRKGELGLESGRILGGGGSEREEEGVEAAQVGWVDEAKEGCLSGMEGDGANRRVDAERGVRKGEYV